MRKKTRTVLTVPIASKNFDLSVLKKVPEPCDWSKNDQKFVSKHAYSFPIILWHFFTRKFSTNQGPSWWLSQVFYWLKTYALINATDNSERDMHVKAPIFDHVRYNHQVQCVFQTERLKLLETIGRRKMSHLWA